LNHLNFPFGLRTEIDLVINVYTVFLVLTGQVPAFGQHRQMTRRITSVVYIYRWVLELAFFTFCFPSVRAECTARGHSLYLRWPMQTTESCHSIFLKYLLSLFSGFITLRTLGNEARYNRWAACICLSLSVCSSVSL